MTDSTYNGFKNWNHWNVSLWINNDESLYRLALSCLDLARNKKSVNLSIASRLMLETLAEQGIYKTPDGAPYSVSSIRSSLMGI